MTWLKGLNEEQKEAVRSTEGPLLILAGAGSGKTTVLVSRTGHLISQGLAKPSEILVLTFTNKAARELNERVSHKLSLKRDKIWTGTFHGFGLEFLKKNHRLANLPQRFGLIDSSDSKFLLKEILKTKTHDQQSGFDLDTLQKVLSDLRAGKKTSPSISEFYLEMAEWVLPDYMSRMHSLGVVDFDELILRPTEILKENEEIRQKYQKKFKYLMVDEFQDTNKVQMDLISQLVGVEQNIAVVGDDDQSIYGWRGAEIQNILGFPKNYKNCKVVRLQTNYRSTPQILNLANSIIQENKDRHKKVLNPRPHVEKGNLPEVYVYKNEETECEEVVSLVRNYNRNHPLKDIAVLFRSNSQGGLLEGVFRQNRIPYDLTGGPALIDRKEVRDVLSYVRAALFPNDICLRRILNLPHRGIGDQSVHKIIEHQKDHDLNFITALRRWRQAGVNEKTGQAIEDFFELLEGVRKKILNHQGKFDALFNQIFSEIGYKKLVLSSYKDGATAQKKWQLVEIVGRVLDSFVSSSPNQKLRETVKDFLDALSLRENDLKDKKEEDKVQLLTFHASKGLEFPVVILMGLDEGLIPHETLGHDVSEERRLFYVGATRAQKDLVMTRAQTRRRYGKNRKTAASRFLLSLPKNLYHLYESGIKPVTETERKDMLSDLYKKLDQMSSSQN